MRCEKLVNGDERKNHVNKIHGGDDGVQFQVFCGGDESKQPKLSFKSVSKVPPSPSDGSTSSTSADSNGNVVSSVVTPPPVPVPAAVHDDAASLAVSQVHGETESPPSLKDLQPVPASDLRRVTAAEDADFHTLHETIKLSSRGYNNDVMIVCSDGCIDSSRVVLSAVFPLFRKLFDVQSYEEDSIISMPDFSSYQINDLLFDIERQTAAINVSGTVLSLLSVECQRSATSVEVPDHEQVESNEQVPEEEVGAGPGHVGKLPQDVGSTHLAPLSHEAPFQPVFREEVQKFLDLKVEVNPDFNSKIIRHGVISKIRDDFDVQIQLPRKGAENAIIMITGYEKNATEARDAILKIVGQFESMVHEEASSDTQVHSMIEQMNDCNGVR